MEMFLKPALYLTARALLICCLLPAKKCKPIPVAEYPK